MIGVRMTPKTRTRLDQASEAHGLTLSEYIRRKGQLEPEEARREVASKSSELVSWRGWAEPRRATVSIGRRQSWNCPAGRMTR